MLKQEERNTPLYTTVTINGWKELHLENDLMIFINPTSPRESVFTLLAMSTSRGIKLPNSQVQGITRTNNSLGLHQIKGGGEPRYYPLFLKTNRGFFNTKGSLHFY